MGSTTMAFNKILVSVLLGSVAGQNSRTFPGFSLNDEISTTTPVPILRFIDQHNNDGSYTYGFQSADGTYKIETRLNTGEVKGKYGYIDVNGNLKETTYGADTGKGFVPVVDGVEFNPAAMPPVVSNEVSNKVPALVEVPREPTPAPRPESRRFSNFRPTEEQSNIKVVNGRRAVLKKRLRSKSEQSAPAAVEQTTEKQLSREEGLRLRQEGLERLERERAALLRLQKQRSRGIIPSARAESPRSFSSAFPTQQRNTSQQQQVAPLSNPFVSGVNSQTGSYTISY